MKIAIISTTLGAPWGGSEELWAAMAEAALDQGHEVIAAIYQWSCSVPRIVNLQAKGAQILPRPLPKRGKLGQLLTTLDASFKRVFQLQPDVIVINQGGTYDPFMMNLGKLFDLLYQSNIPYSVICQRNEDSYVPDQRIRDAAIPFFEQAAQVSFVAEHNLKAAERQLARSLPNAQVVRNPVNLTDHNVVPWCLSSTVQFANVARLEVGFKGQDILFEALSGDEWRDRPWQLNLYGGGTDRDYIERLCQYYNLSERVNIVGHVNDVRSIWADNHLLVLPSRREGTPLALVEAMLCGRPAVVTDVGGNAEWIEEGKTGYIAAAPTASSFGAALERAWQAQDQWKMMGAIAREVAINQYDPTPGHSLLEIILSSQIKASSSRSFITV
jgi:glycosyltransferase involved in cell wall biosynthesis